MRKSIKLFYAWLYTSIMTWLAAGFAVILGENYFVRLLFISVFLGWYWIGGYVYHKWMIQIENEAKER